jgi:hypothetical protein
MFAFLVIALWRELSGFFLLELAGSFFFFLSFAWRHPDCFMLSMLDFLWELLVFMLAHISPVFFFFFFGFFFVGFVRHSLEKIKYRLQLFQ